MLSNFSLIFLFFLSISQLVYTRSSFNLSELKRRQHRHAHHPRRDLFEPVLGDGNPLGGIFPHNPPQQSASTSQSSVSSTASITPSDTLGPSPTTSTDAESTSTSSSDGGLLGGLPLGGGPNGGLLPSLTLPPILGGGGGNTPTPTGGASPTPSNGGGGGGGLLPLPLPSLPLPLPSLPPIIGGPGNNPSPSQPGSPAPSSSGGGGLLPLPLPLPPISLPPVSLPPISLPPIIGGGPGGGASQSGASPSSAGGGLLPPLSLPPISLPPVSLPPIIGGGGNGGASPTSSVIIGLPSITLPPIFPTSSSGSGGGGGILPSIIPSISIPPILPSISIPPVLPTISVPPILPPPSSTGGGVLPPISLPPPFSSPPSAPGLPSISIGNPPSSSVFSSAPSGVSSSASGSLSLTTVFQPSTTQAPTTSIGSQFSFITESSLQINSLPTSTVDPTQTDPDAPTTTIIMPSGTGLVASPTLPPNLPQMILPVPPLDTSPQNLAGMTLITLLFEPQLGYQFILNHEQTQGQIWAYEPQAIGSALGISPDDVKALWMKPFAPVDYSGDPSSLMTIYNAYIPSGSVNDMAHQISTPTSQYFIGSQGVPGQLANFTVPGFPLLYSADPYSSQSNGGNSPGNTTVASGQAASNKRRNAIIAVCSVIGGIALIVLGWWLYKTHKRRQESAHQRLNDPLGFGTAGYGATDSNVMRQTQAPPSIGPDGVRRNSFYFAEDSLRGYRDHVRDMEEEAQLSTSVGGRGRVQGAQISTPILRHTTLEF